MSTPFLSNYLYIKNSSESGRCVYSRTSINKGEVLERALTIPLPISEKDIHDQSIIWHYYCITEPYLPDENFAGHLLLGIGSICNHSSNPNARLVWSQNSCGVWATLELLEAVDANEEITITYTNIADYISKGLIIHQLEDRV